MSKLLAEIKEAQQNFLDHAEGKITLRTHHVPSKKPIVISKSRILKIRAANGMSREFFARCLHTSGRTIEKWEQGVTRPSGLAATMLALLEKRPELVGELASL